MSTVIAQRSRIEEEDELRIAQRQIERENMTAEQRAAERAQIEELMGACGEAELVEDTDLSDELIAAGLVPIVDPISQQDGVAIDDLVAIHGICMSRTAVLRYLESNRYNYNNPPRMPTGLPITQHDLQTQLGLNPLDFGFFNPNLPRAGPAPEVEPLDLEALGLDEQEVNAIGAALDDMDEDNGVVVVANVYNLLPIPQGPLVFATGREGEVFYLERLTQVLLSYDAFVELLTRPFSLRNGAFTRYFDAENHSLFSRMAILLDDLLAEPAILPRIKHRARIIFEQKAFYLLNIYRDRLSRRYNIYRRDNDEILTLILRDAEFAIRLLATHAHSVLQFPFIELHSTRLSEYFEQNVAMRISVIGARDREQLVTTLNSPRLPALRDSFLSRRRELGLQLTRNLASDQAFFDRIFGPPQSRFDSTWLEMDLVVPQTFLLNADRPNGEIRLKYVPEEFDLFYHIADRSEWVDKLVRNYRGDTTDGSGRRRAFDISRDGWRAVQWVIDKPASLRALLSADASHPELRTRSIETMDNNLKEEFLALATDTESNYILLFYFGRIPRSTVNRARVGLPPPVDLTQDE